MHLIRRKSPWPLRTFDRLVGPIAPSLLRLELDSICTKAEWTTGCSDYGHPAYMERLERMVRSAGEHPDVTPTGRISQRIFLHWHVTNRLREVDLLRRHPEILDIPLPSPVIVVGGYRTGTTHLHNLLAQDPGFHAPATWEISFQAHADVDPYQDRARRRQNTRAILAMNRLLIPDQAEVHPVFTDEPEECHFLLENAALSMTHYITFLGYEYANWLLTQDVADAYDSLRAQYQILRFCELRENPDAPERRWLLKCPLHIWYLPELMRVFPDAQLLWTHRPMVQTLASTCGLTAITASKFFRQVRGTSVGDFWLNYYQLGLARGLSARDARPDFRIKDVQLRDVSTDPLGTVADIYQHLGTELSEQTRANIESYVAVRESANDAPGRHHYKPEEFGLEPKVVNRIFEDYHARYNVLPRDSS